MTRRTTITLLAAAGLLALGLQTPVSATAAPPAAIIVPTADTTEPTTLDTSAPDPNSLETKVNAAADSSQALLTAAGLAESVQQQVTYDPPVLTVYSAKTIPSSLLNQIRKANPAVSIVAVKTRYSVEELSAEGLRIASSNAGGVSWAGPSVDLSRIEIGATTLAADGSSVARAALPSADTFTSYPATVEPAAPISETLTRKSDTPPAYGGARIVRNDGRAQCTSGVPVNYTLASSPTTSRTGFMTAWHCGTGFRWNNSAGALLGSANLGISDSGTDAQVVNNSISAGSNRIWVGAYNSSTTKYVAGAANPTAGQTNYCTGGSMTGSLCGLKTGSNLNLAVTTYDANGVRRVYYPSFAVENPRIGTNDAQQCAAQPGDSGGPIYTVGADGRATIRGLISAVALTTVNCPGDPDHPAYDYLSDPAVAPGIIAYGVRIPVALTAVRATVRTGGP